MSHSGTEVLIVKKEELPFNKLKLSLPSHPEKVEKMSEIQKFIKSDAVKTLLEEDETAEKYENALKRLRTVMEYTVPGGSKRRSDIVLQSFKVLKPDATAAEINLAENVGIIVQIHQAAVLVADDIFDQSQTRRGKLCWYLVSGVEHLAFNDVLVLEHSAYRLLLKMLPRDNSNMCLEMLELFLDASYKLCLGEIMDLETGVKWNNFDTYTLKHYLPLIDYKTAYYFIYLPIGCAMLLAGISKAKNKEAWKLITDITLEVGRLFQIKDDYNDCFGNAEETGKIGSDIENGKCTWLFAKAKELCETNKKLELWENLKSCYGKNDKESVNQVKDIYLKLRIPEEFQNLENAMRTKIISQIEKIQGPTKPLKLMLIGFVKKVFTQKET